MSTSVPIQPRNQFYRQKYLFLLIQKIVYAHVFNKKIFNHISIKHYLNQISVVLRIFAILKLI